jgi:hypothetical protein
VGTTIVIRDVSTVTGGGYAETHVVWCELLAQRPVVPGVFVVDEWFDRTTVDGAELSFRTRFTVPVEVRRCRCAELHVERQAAEWARRVAMCEDD